MRRIHLLALTGCMALCLGASDCADDPAPGSRSANLQEEEFIVPDDRNDGGDAPVSSAPEPSSALIFAAGLAIAYAASRRS